MTAEKSYYTYMHRKPGIHGNAGVFYIGKGKGDRAWHSNHHQRGTHWINTVKKYGVQVIILARWRTPEEAYAHERIVIALLFSAGAPLVNKTMGGEGFNLTADAMAGRAISVRAALNRPEVRARISAGVRAANTPEMIKRRGESVSRALADPVAKKKRIAQMDAMRSDPDIQKKRIGSMVKAGSDPAYRQKKREISLENGNQPPIYQGANHPMARKVRCIDEGHIFLTGRDAVAWLKAGGSEKASPSAIASACRGRLKTAYGYRWEYA